MLFVALFVYTGVVTGLHLLQLFKKGLGAALLVVGLAYVFVQVPLPADVGVLKRIGPSAELAGAGFCLRFQI